jgi:outer membrane protein assembly factor BamB
MKKLLIIVSALIVIVAIGYAVVYLLSSDPKISSTPKGKKIELSDNQTISEWREEDRTGVSAETGLLKIWPTEGPQLIWSNADLPKGHSSVKFGNNTIYLTGLNGQNDVLVALDNSGKIKWQTPYGRCWNGATPESRCTPTVEGDRVYVSSGYGDLACINGISGEIIWSLKASEIYKGTYGEWGIAESLIIDGQKLYFTPGGLETMTIALDKTTGQLIWKSESINDSPAYVSPILIDYAGKKIIINVSLHYIFAVDASNGAILWKINHLEAIDSKKSTAIWPDAPLIKCVTPLYHDGRIYVTGGYDHGSILLALNEDGTKASTVWTDEVLDVHHGGVVLVDGYVYGSNWLSNSNGNWCCLEWNTGKKMYEENWKCKGSIISAEGMLYVYDEKSGFVGLVKATPEKFDLVSSFRIKGGTGPYWSHPVINNGNLFLRHGEYLAVYSIKSK